jgi:hypothetical protein
VAKYGSSRDGWRSSDITESHGVGLWKYICMGWSKFKRHFRFDPGVGSKISFWEDAWCGESPLKGTFPGLFNIARFREASIADNMEHANGFIQWNIVFTRLFHDWEVETLASIIVCILGSSEGLGRTSCGGSLREKVPLR